MKVLMFGWEFPPFMSGGLGTACFGLTKAMAMQGAQITFVLPKIFGEHKNAGIRIVGPESLNLVDSTEDDGSTAEHLKKYIKVDAALHPYLDDETYKQSLERLRANDAEDAAAPKKKKNKLEFTGNYGGNLISEVYRYAIVGKFLGEKEDFDVIHAHDWLSFMAGIEAKKVSGKPLIVHVHATEFDRAGEHVNAEIYRIERLGVHEADHVIAVSDRTKKILIEKYGVAADKITVIYNGVDQKTRAFYDRSFRPFPEDKLVLFLGRITMQKGPEYFLEAANLVMQKVPNVRFVMAGSGDMTRRMIERMASLRLSERFHFTGFLNEEERDRVFSMSDLYVMPSVSEPFGITPLEAMQYQVPVIISNQSGIAEVLDHVVKVDFWDVKQLAEAMVQLLTDPQLHRKMVESHPVALRKFDWQIAATGIIKLYESIAK